MSSGTVRALISQCQSEIDGCRARIDLLQKEIADLSVLYAKRDSTFQKAENDYVLRRRRLDNIGYASDEAKAARDYLLGMDVDLSTFKNRVALLGGDLEYIGAEKRKRETKLQEEQSWLGTLNSRIYGLQNDLAYWLNREAEEAAASLAAEAAKGNQ